jgi:hypothetical protein
LARGDREPRWNIETRWNNAVSIECFDFREAPLAILEC